MSQLMDTMIQKLQDAIERIDEALHTEAETSQPDAEKLVEDVFEQRLNQLSKYDRRRSGAGSDLEYSVMKRRKQAILSLLPQANERYAQRYPELRIEEEMIRLCAPGTAMTFDELNREYAVELAAAIWILDALTASGSYEDASAYFPKTREELDRISLPNLSDAAHSDDALKAAVYLIRYRNRGSEGFEESKAFMDEADTRLKETEEDAALPDRSAYDAVIALLDTEAVKAARERFLRAQQELTDSVFELLDRRRKELTALRKATRDELSEKLQVCREAAPAEAPAPVQGEFSSATVTASDAARLMNDAAAIEKRLRELEEELQKKETELEQLCTYIQLVPAYGAGQLPADGEMQAFDGLQLPEVCDPYELCFAFLSLLDDNSDAVWSYNLAYDMLGIACRALPWADAGAVNPDDAEELEVDFEYLAAVISEMPDWDDNRTNGIMYKKRFHSLLNTPGDQRISISQLAFLSSGLIPPRRGNSISYTKALLHDSDLTQEQAELWYEYLSLAYAVAHKEAEYEDADESGEEESAGSEDAAAELKQLRSEVKRLKKALHQLENRNKETENRLSEANRRLDASNRELAELRTMIRETDESAPNETVSVSLPYTATKRSVIIGGHDSWVKAIKPLLNNVRFISSSEQPNTGVIMNAEVVWLQTNALGHSGYYKIIDIVRRNHIKVCYFRYASAEKCAEQFALEDLGEEAAE